MNNNKICSNCGNILSDTAKFCSSCGQSIIEDNHNNIVDLTKRCNKCGKEVVSNNAIFCKYCGNKLNIEQKVTKPLSTKSDNVEDVKKNIVKKYAIICLISAIVFLITSVSLKPIFQGEEEVEKSLSIFLTMSAPLMYIFSSIIGIAVVKDKGFLNFLAIVFGIVSCIIMAILNGDPAGFFIEIVFFVALYCMLIPCFVVLADGYPSNKQLKGCFIYSIVITTIFSVISIIFPVPVLAILVLIIILTIFSGGKAQQGILLIFIK